MAQQLQCIESDTALMSWLIDESIRLSGTIVEYERREREIDESWKAVEHLKSQVERLDAVHSASEALRDNAVGKWQRRELLIATLDASTKELAGLEGEAMAAAPGLEAATRRREEAAAAHKAADAAVRKAQAGLSRAIADRDHLRQLIEVEQLRERHDRYLAAEQPSSKPEAS